MWKMELEARPFRGTFFDLERVGHIKEVIAPPYDVIDDREKESLLRRSPFNVVRLILPVDGEEEFWRDAARTFQRWKEEGIFRVDPEPAVYLYRQAFTLPDGRELERTGAVVLLRCVDFSQGVVLPHEMTFPRTRNQQLNLLRACRANFSQVFVLVRDEEGLLLRHLGEAAESRTPFLDFRDEQGVRHRLSRMEETEWALRLFLLMRDRKAVIADGHHRYETAVLYAEENAGQGDDHPGRFVSVCVYSSSDPGLVSLPVHRVLAGVGLPRRGVLRELGEYFEVEEVPADSLPAAVGRGERTAFGLLFPDRGVLLTLKPGLELEELVAGEHSPGWKNLDVSILHHLVIFRVLGEDPVLLAEAGKLTFTPWAEEAMEKVGSGEAEAAFLIRPTPLEVMWELAEKGERMPHKSTYFYPKLPSGLVIYDHATGLTWEEGT